MTLKEMLNQAMLEVGFAPLSEIFTSTRQEARQLTALANRELNQYKKDEWEALREQHFITQTTATSYPLPADYRQFVADTAYDNTRRVNFPTSSQVWAYYTARNVTSGLRQRMRLADGQIEFLDPQPGTEVYIEYISDSPVRSATDVPQKKFSSDDDTLILNDEVFILGIIWRWMKVKGLDWQQNYQEYRRMYNREKATDSGAQTIQTGELEYQGPFVPHTDLWRD